MVLMATYVQQDVFSLTFMSDEARRSGLYSIYVCPRTTQSRMVVANHLPACDQATALYTYVNSLARTTGIASIVCTYPRSISCGLLDALWVVLAYITAHLPCTSKHGSSPRFNVQPGYLFIQLTRPYHNTRRGEYGLISLSCIVNLCGALQPTTATSEVPGG